MDGVQPDLPVGLSDGVVVVVELMEIGGGSDSNWKGRV